MNILLKKIIESFWLIILTSIMFTCSICEAQEIHFEHVVIDKKAIGHREVGDIDGDGFNDIAAVDYPMLVWYEHPDWKKHIVVDISQFDDFKTYRACDMELADIDGDDDLDIVGRIGIPESDREGMNCWFENPRPHGNPAKDTWKRHNIGATEYVKDIEVRDFDNDDKPDIVVRTNTKVCVYLQRKPDSWTPISINIHDHEGMEAGDLDRDGDPDIVLNGFWLETPGNPGKGKWIEHNIDKKWWNQKTGSWTDNNCKVSVADMNKDGRLDVLLSHSEKAGYPICWYEAPGDPTKSPWKEHVIGQLDKCHNLKAADFDKDGDLDVLAAEMPNIPGEAPHPVVIFINISDCLKWEQQTLANYGNYSAQAGDIDNDGDIDIIGLRNHNRAPIELWRNKTSDNKLSLDDWTYIEVDNSRGKWGDWDKPEWLRYFGLAMTDVNGDGYKDIIAGRYFYRNPGGDMTGSWSRIMFDSNVDAMLALDVDSDMFADAIAEALPDVLWLEAEDIQGDSWKVTKIGTAPKTGHVNGQGYMLAQIIAGGKPEVLLAAEDGIYCFEVPKAPEKGHWPKTRIASETMDEGIGVGDLDGDGDTDIVTGHQHDEERWPGKEPDANLYWYEQMPEITFRRHLVVTEYSLNNLDVADLDGDGDMDIITCEHKGPKAKQRLQVFENEGKGKFTEHIVDRGKESHLGARVADMDNDGDYDIVSAAWDYPEFLHLWRNNAVGVQKDTPTTIRWQHLSTRTADIEYPDVGRQAASLILDIDQDGIDIWLNKGTAHISQPWKRDDYKYRTLIRVGAAGYARQDKPVEIEIDFSKLLRRLGKSDFIDPQQIVLYEQRKGGLTRVPFQFDRDVDFHPWTDAKGTLTFILDASTAPHQVRRFELYFGDRNGFRPDKLPAIAPLVSVQRVEEHEGQASYCVAAQNAVYYYHKFGAGFASLEDRDGNDWLSYNPGVGPESRSGSGGKYRGTPNMGHPEGYCHPGEAVSDTCILSMGPIKATLESQSHDGKMHCLWDIFPRYARMTVLKMRLPYWFLYEGTPGGKLDMPMTVFGFGRLGLNKYMRATPAYFTLGLTDSTDADQIHTAVNNACQPLNIALGPVEARGQTDGSWSCREVSVGPGQLVHANMSIEVKEESHGNFKYERNVAASTQRRLCCRSVQHPGL